MRYDLSDYEWSVIQPIFPKKARGMPRVDDRRVLNCFLGLAIRSTVASFAKLLWPIHYLLQSLQPMV